MKHVMAASIAAMFVLFLFVGCKKETTTLATGLIGDYFPLEVGKTYLYRLDSTVSNTPLCPHGLCLDVHSYQAKDSVESTFTDNQGRLSYRIFRLIRDTAGTQPWVFAATFVATPTREQLEFIDNNLRFIKLRAPLRQGYKWKGNSFIDTKSVNSTVQYMDEWEYEYDNVGNSFSVLGKTYDNTLTVMQQDETTPEGIFNPANYQQRNFSVEVYAKGVGLIYKEFLHWTWQTTPGPAHYEDGAYGVKLRLIE